LTLALGFGLGAAFGAAEESLKADLAARADLQLAEKGLPVTDARRAEVVAGLVDQALERFARSALLVA
jgi:predicted secreted protein